MMAESSVSAPIAATPGWAGLARVAIGLGQGVAMALLMAAKATRAWPASMPPLFAGLVLIVAFTPIIVIVGLGRMRPAPLIIWTLVAAAVLAMFGWHDIDASLMGGLANAARAMPDLRTFGLSAAFVFVGHHLVAPAAEARKPIAPYPLYFDQAWKDAIQLGLAAAFVGVFWAALELGAALFGAIGVDAVGHAIAKAWVWAPVTTTVFAVGLHLTGVRETLGSGVRTLALALLSWLLPVTTVLVVAFPAALPFTGLTALLGARGGAQTMLWTSAVLIVLISAAYQDGRTPSPPPIRWAARAASLALVPLALIAADALRLRVGQYGLTPARVEGIVTVLVVAGFAAGYALAAVRRGRWMRALEPTNVVMAAAGLVGIVVLLTPIADPARLSVDDQLARLGSGLAPDRFDFDFLTYRAGRYGAEALRQLAAKHGGPRDTQIAALAAKGERDERPLATLKPPALASRFEVFPTGAQLPKSFIGQDWAADNEPYQDCSTNPGASQCVAVLADVDGDGLPEVLVTQQTTGAGAVLDIYKQGADGRWWEMGQLNVACADAIAALKAGQLKLSRTTDYAVELAGQRQPVTLAAAPCPSAATNSIGAPAGAVADRPKAP